MYAPRSPPADCSSISCFAVVLLKSLWFHGPYCPAKPRSGVHAYYSLIFWFHRNLKLLQFRVSGDSLLHTLSLDIPTSKLGNPAYLEGGRTPFCYIAYQLIFDAETQSFYEICRDFSSELVSDGLLIL